MSIATHTECKRFRNSEGYDVVHNTFKLSQPITHGKRCDPLVTVSVTNDDTCDAQTLVYLGTVDHDAPVLLREREMLTCAEALTAIGVSMVHDRHGEIYAPLPREVCPKESARRSSYTFRPGDTLIATDEAEDLGLTQGDRVRIDAISYRNRLTLSASTDECDESGHEVRRVIECSAMHPGLRPARFRWTVEIEIAAQWVADGADLTADAAQRVVQAGFPCLTSSEISARTIAAPDANDVACEQGYRSAADKRAKDAKRRGR